MRVDIQLYNIQKILISLLFAFGMNTWNSLLKMYPSFFFLLSSLSFLLSSFFPFSFVLFFSLAFSSFFFKICFLYYFSILSPLLFFIQGKIWEVIRYDKSTLAVSDELSLKQDGITSFFYYSLLLSIPFFSTIIITDCFV